jgi:hypothetical protein
MARMPWNKVHASKGESCCSDKSQGVH